MDYAIIFIVILVIIIIIVTIVAIYANRGNTLNLLSSLPNYRIIDQQSKSYISLKNFPAYQPGTTPNIGAQFWLAKISIGFDNIAPLGIWKLENITGVKDQVVSGSIIYLINTVYNLETPGPNHLGYVSFPSFNSNGFAALAPTTSISTAAKFIFTLIDINIFTLQYKLGDSILPILVDKNTNLLSVSNNKLLKPSILQLQLI